MDCSLLVSDTPAEYPNTIIVRWTFHRNPRCTPSKAWPFWTTTAIAYSPNTTTAIYFPRSKNKKPSRRTCSTAPTEPTPKSLCWTASRACTRATSICSFTLWAVPTRTKYVWPLVALVTVLNVVRVSVAVDERSTVHVRFHQSDTQEKC